MKFQNGFLYKTTSLEEHERAAVLEFLNNQPNATDSLHTVILNHIRQFGTKKIDLETKSLMLQLDSTIKPTQTISMVEQVEQTQHSIPVEQSTTNRAADNKTEINKITPKVNVNLKNY